MFRKMQNLIRMDVKLFNTSISMGKLLTGSVIEGSLETVKYQI